MIFTGTNMLFLSAMGTRRPIVELATSLFPIAEASILLFLLHIFLVVVEPKLLIFIECSDIFAC